MKLPPTSITKKTKTIYCVWVGDGIVYEGDSQSQANHVYELWLKKGYDDVQIEEWYEHE